jgi:hypothetical protein
MGPHLPCGGHLSATTCLRSIGRRAAAGLPALPPPALDGAVQSHLREAYEREKYEARLARVDADVCSKLHRVARAIRGGPVGRRGRSRLSRRALLATWPPCSR